MANACQGVVFVITCPCRACGGDSFNWLGRALASPFTPYLLTTVALHLPPVGWGIRAAIGVLNEAMRCSPGDRWLWINAGLSMIHIWGAFYIVKRIQDERISMNTRRSSTATPEILEFDDENDGVWNTSAETDGTITPVPRTKFQTLPNSAMKKPMKMPTLGDKVLYTIGKTTTFPSSLPASKSWKERASRDVVLGVSGDDDGEANSLQRLKQVFCYDMVVALYMATVVFWCIWQSVGISHVLFRKRPANHANPYGQDYGYNDYGNYDAYGNDNANYDAYNGYNNANNAYDNYNNANNNYNNYNNANNNYNNAYDNYNNAYDNYNNAYDNYNNYNANGNINYNMYNMQNANANYDNANDNNNDDMSNLIYNYFDSHSNYDEDELCDNIEYWIILSILCSFLYIMLVCVAFSCSLLCMRY